MNGTEALRDLPFLSPLPVVAWVDFSLLLFFSRLKSVFFFRYDPGPEFRLKSSVTSLVGEKQIEQNTYKY